MPVKNPDFCACGVVKDEGLTLEGGGPPRAAAAGKPVLDLARRRAKIAPPVADELQIPKEGLSTLSAAFTREYVEKIIRVLKQLREKGTSEAAIRLKIDHELKNSVDAFSRRRLYDMSRDLAIPDDFAPDAIVEERETKPGSFVVKVTKTPAGFIPGTLMHHRGKCCCIVRLEGQTLHLKTVR